MSIFTTANNAMNRYEYEYNTYSMTRSSARVETDENVLDGPNWFEFDSFSTFSG